MFTPTNWVMRAFLWKTFCTKAKDVNNLEEMQVVWPWEMPLDEVITDEVGYTEGKYNEGLLVLCNVNE